MGMHHNVGQYAIYEELMGGFVVFENTYNTISTLNPGFIGMILLRMSHPDPLAKSFRIS